MELHPIRTEADYQAALKEIESLFDASPHHLNMNDWTYSAHW
jgi:antitoxin component HigA of HigAB toxin-antitoxin module